MPWDPDTDLDDPEVWYPNGMLIDNRLNSKKTEGDDDDEEDTIVLDVKDMQALNRFLGSGRQLPTTRGAYLRGLGIEDSEGEISTRLGEEISRLLGVYGNIKTDCVQFKDVTWQEIIDLAGEIKTYAQDLAGDYDESYRGALLYFVGEYYTEKKKPSGERDEDYIEDLEDAIKDLVDSEITHIDRMHDGAQKAIDGLRGFEGKCEDHKVEVSNSKTALERQLADEGANIDDLTEAIDEIKESIDEIQAGIDAKNKQIKDAPKYMWVWPWGTLAGTIIVVNAKKERALLKDELEKIKKLLEENKGKLEVATALTVNIEAITGQVSGLRDEIQPAIENLQRLQGAWESMRTDLTGLRQVVGKPANKIPSLLLVEGQLNNIGKRWGRLMAKADNYINIAYVTAQPTNLDEYISQIEAAILREEKKEKLAIRMKKAQAKKQQFV